MKAVALISLLWMPFATCAEPQVTRFIRVEEDDATARLQTAVTRYEKDGVKVELIGAVHIADKAYYEKLNERFGNYDALLFEMIGGERADKLADPAKLPKAEPGKEKPPTEALHAIYTLVSQMLKLESQTAWIDYSPDHFVHADLSLEEFQTLQKQRGESVLGFAMKNHKAAQGAAQPDTRKLMTALLSGNSSLVKLQLIHTLGAGDDQIRTFAGESVIISDRNVKALEVLAKQIQAGHQNIGIFYGAAHFPDMEERLLKVGWRKIHQEWMNAWDVPKPQPIEKNPPAPEEEKDAA